MKTKIVYLLAFIFIFSISSEAQLLWKISGKGLEKPSFLFGTHHLIDKTQIKDFDKILKFAKISDAVVGEMDVTDMTSAQTVLMQASMLSGQTCKDLYSANDYAFLDNEFKALLGIGMEKLGVMKPMALNTLYVLFSYLKMEGLTKQPEAVDVLFQKEALQNQKKVIGLETPEFQANILFNSSTVEVQAKDLLMQVKNKDKSMEQTKELNEAYLKGDFASAEALEKADSSMTPEEKFNLITNRNNKWMNKLPGLLRQQTCFVAVGFLHLVGESGLVRQLKDAGYHVEPVIFR